MPPHAKNPFTADGWTLRPPPTAESPAPSSIVLHPDREVLVLYCSGGESSLLSHCKLTPLLPDGVSWNALFTNFNARMAPHDQLSTIDENESLSGLGTWHRRLQVWHPLKPSVRILNQELHNVWFCSYRGATCFLHFLAFSGGSADVPVPQALSSAAKKAIMQDWKKQDNAHASCNPLKRLFVSSTCKSDKFQKSYKECVDVLKSFQWWPSTWAHQGPDVRLASVSDSIVNPLPLCRENGVGLRDELAQHLNKHVLGQPDAVRRTVEAVVEKLSGAAEVHKPAVIVSAGPSGHGKTHLVKYLVEALFPGASPEQLDAVYLYFSVSHLTDKTSLSSLIGASQGLNTSEHPGRLVTFLQHQQKALSPAHGQRTIHWIVFLDEVDRAYPSLLEDLRQWFDQGVVISGFGETLHARNGVIILGTNAGTGITVRTHDGRDRQSTIDVLSRSAPTSAAERDHVMKEVKRAVLEDLCHGQPATYGRLTYIVPFFQFSPEEFKQLLAIWLHSEVRGRIQNFQGVPVPSGLAVRFGGDVIDWLHSTYDEKAGLRGLTYRVNRVAAELTKLFSSARCQDLARHTTAFGIDVSLRADDHLCFSHQEQSIVYQGGSGMSGRKSDLIQSPSSSTASAKKRAKAPTAAVEADDATSAAAAPRVTATRLAQPSDSRLKSCQAIADAINQLGSSFRGSREEFQAAVACELGGHTGSDIAASTFKKAFRLSRFRSKGKSKQWVLVLDDTPMHAESTSSVADDDDADESEGASTSDRKKRQRTTAPASITPSTDGTM